MAFIHSLKVTAFILKEELAMIHCLSNSFSSGIFISKKIGSRYVFYIVERHCNYLYRILAANHSFNSTARFSDVKICSHPIFPTHFLSAYFRTQVTVKKTYQSSYIFRAASVLLKWEQLLKGTASSKKSFFSECVVVWSSYSCVTTISR